MKNLMGLEFIMAVTVNIVCWMWHHALTFQRKLLPPSVGYPVTKQQVPVQYQYISNRLHNIASIPRQNNLHTKCKLQFLGSCWIIKSVYRQRILGSLSRHKTI
jgi:hypothetical protein